MNRSYPTEATRHEPQPWMTTPSRERYRRAAPAVLLAGLLTLTGCATNLNDPRYRLPGPSAAVVMSDAYRQKLNAIAEPFSNESNGDRALVAVMKYDARHEKLLSSQIAAFINARVFNDAERVEAISALFEENAERRSVLINPEFSKRSPAFILPLEPSSYAPSSRVVLALQTLFGPSADLDGLKVHRIRGSVEEPTIIGLTVGRVAFSNDHTMPLVAHALKLDPELVRDAIIANEAAHLVATRLNTRVALASRHSRQKVEKILELKTLLEPTQIHEFLSDVASLNVDPAGLKLLMSSAGSAMPKRKNDGEFWVNPKDRYALSAHVLRVSLEEHAKTHLSEEQHGLFRRLPYWTARLLPEEIPPGLYEAVRADFLDKARLILAAMR